MHRHFRLFNIAVAAAALSACVSGPRAPTGLPYRAPDAGQPSASVTVMPPRFGLESRHSEHLLRHDVQCQPDGSAKSQPMALSAWYKNAQGYQPKVLALPAGRAYFKYERIANQATCSLNFSAQLVADHAYTITTERNFKGILKGVECVLRMVDANTGEAVQLDYESVYPDFGPMCRKQARDAGRAQAGAH